MPILTLTEAFFECTFDCVAVPPRPDKLSLKANIEVVLKLVLDF